MYFRCATCHGSIWADGSDLPTTAKPACERCERSYDLTEAFDRKPGRKLGARARELARREEIDLPGAYSVVLGLIPLDVVLEFGSSGSTVCRTRSTEIAPDGHPAGTAPFDPDFDAAVRAGQLTPRQAQERGKRATFAERMIARHGLTPSEAFDVADNRRSLLETLRLRESARAETIVARPASLDGGDAPRTAWVYGAAAIGLLALVALGAAFVLGTGDDAPSGASLQDELGGEVHALDAAARQRSTPPTPFAARAATAEAAEVTVDPATGEVVRISAPTPDAVLRAFCERSIFHEPIDVRPAVPPVDARRIGVLRDTRALDRPVLLFIARDGRGGRWSVGDGARAVTATPAPDQLLRHVSR